MPPLLVDLIHARACKPFCEKSLTLPYFILLPISPPDTFSSLFPDIPSPPNVVLFSYIRGAFVYCPVLLGLFMRELRPFLMRNFLEIKRKDVFERLCIRWAEEKCLKIKTSKILKGAIYKRTTSCCHKDKNRHVDK